MEALQNRKIFIETVGKAAQKDWEERHLCLPSLAIAIAAEGTGWGGSRETLERKELYPFRRDKRSDVRYASFEASVRSHNEFLASFRETGQTGPNWRKLMGQENYILAVQYLQEAEYPYRDSRLYEAGLVRLIESFGLTAFDGQ